MNRGLNIGSGSRLGELGAFGIKGGGASVSIASSLYVKDVFTTNESAPIASPRTSEPGPGTLTVTQTDGQFSIANSKLVIPAQATAAWGDLGFVTGADIARAGLCIAFTVNLATVNELVVGLGNGTGLGNASVMHGYYFGSAGDFFQTLENNWSLAPTVGAGSVSTPYTCYVIARATAGCWLIVGTSLFWVSSIGTTATLRGKLTNKLTTGTLDDLKMAILPAPWSTDYGIATQQLAGNRAANDTFTHEADCLIEFTCTTVPSGGNVDLRFRQQDATNYWQVTIDSTGALTLNEVVAGSPTQRATAAGVISNGHRVVIVASGTTIKAISNSANRWSYASASNFATATAGLLADEGTGGSISDIVSWPRTLSGAALSTLNFT